ncbi:phthiotriol/phenolphthiotriol dimycocerosates methyltransferase [Mycobacterium branderi]|uniref:Fatty-acid O-methyltransferase n=1 Tax=Mycobacterium branderi TaxID=43348 RepID=A0ABM7KPC7_9MYCO|nr:class I SAM-dependent methyltransferase [Mycobacterium branderi]MCV7235107.1 class I SAM-dependent methyltransferase [Mycobacterium branderi]BBZ13019.1 fatty-acid O-methyltransferase [Mycobacterium branderi]
MATTIARALRDGVIEPATKAVIYSAQRRLYRYLTGRVADDAVFLNYGYEQDPPMGLPLDAADEPERYPIQLYHATATQAGGLAGQRVLEVGCGHGGGASYLTRALAPASYIGMDVNAAGIEFCRRRHQVPGLDFVHGDAENLPFPPDSFDAVINVESSHCYPHFDRFLAEVSRVLRPGGKFLYTDLRQRSVCAQWEAELNSAPGLQVVSWRNIDAEVLRGMTLNSERMQASMENAAPRFLRRWVRDMLPVHGSAIYRNIQSGRDAYRMYCLTKETNRPAEPQ